MTKQNNSIPIAKSLNEELKQATFLVLSPDEVDLHGDIYSADEVRKACHNYNQYCRKANLFHLEQTDAFDIVESYIAPVDMVVNDVVIKAGAWMSVVQVNDDDLWEGIKDNTITGVSIGAYADTEYLEG